MLRSLVGSEMCIRDSPNSPAVAVNFIESKGLHNLAKVWSPFFENGCGVYYLSNHGLRILDDYALVHISRIFPLDDPDPLTQIPLLREGDQDVESLKINDKNIIVIGRLRSFNNSQLDALLLEDIYKYARFRFTSNNEVFDIEEGSSWMRVENEALKVGYGVIRYWRKGDQSIINLCGAGAIGTLAATKGITEFSKSITRKIDNIFASSDEVKFIEILLKGQWEEDFSNRFLTSENLSLEIKRFYLASEQDQLSPPVISFQRNSTSENLLEVWVKGKGRKKHLTSQPIQVAIIAAIAERTFSEDSTAIEREGYISHQEIVESPIFQAMSQGQERTVHTVRVTLTKLRKKLADSVDWRENFRGLFLETDVKKDEGRGRKKKVIRLRAKINWDSKFFKVDEKNKKVLFKSDPV